MFNVELRIDEIIRIPFAVGCIHTIAQLKCNGHPLKILEKYAC